MWLYFKSYLVQQGTYEEYLSGELIKFTWLLVKLFVEINLKLSFHWNCVLSKVRSDVEQVVWTSVLIVKVASSDILQNGWPDSSSLLKICL